MSRDVTLKIYLISFKAGRVGLFAPREDLERFEKDANDRLRRIIDWLQASRFSLVSWLGRVLYSCRGYYVRLEARLDPIERILKAMDSAGRYAVCYPEGWEEQFARKQFFARLRRQRIKHMMWCGVDFVCSVAALAIAFLPGPNLVGWYPFLRALSHYHAVCGTGAALRSSTIAFKGLPELRTLEENLQAPGFNRKRIHAIAEDLKISGLEQFLERMV
ncbi:MAG TPA: hypothetical protein VFR18_16325 [Terriglobia bacterium]|nr:hypothetical protein [Terriglobia bacterium]